MVRVRAVVVVAASIAATATGALLAGSCAHHDRELPRAGVAASETRATGQPQAEAVAPPDGGARVAAPGVPTDAARGALQPLAWACLSDAAPIVQALSRVVGMQVAAGDERDMARALVGRLLGLHPALAAALGLRRPAVVALLRAEPGDPGPAPAALLPIASRQEVLAAAGRAGLSVEERPWGVVLRGAAGAGPSPSSASPSMPSPSLPAPGERAAVIAVAFAGDYAAISAREEQAPRVAAALAPLREHKAEAPLAIHLDVARLFESSGPTIEAALARFGRAAASTPDPQIPFALRAAPRLLKLADSVEGVDLLLDADGDGVQVTARAEGRPNGAFAQFAASQHGGPPWGLELLPRDAVVAYSTRRGAATDAEVASRATEAAVADAGTGAIVSVSAAQGARYEVVSRLPASSLPGLPRIGGVLWRMALSPLLNPPAIPPLPLLPAHLPPPESPALRPSRPTARSPSQRL